MSAIYVYESGAAYPSLSILTTEGYKWSLSVLLLLLIVLSLYGGVDYSDICKKRSNTLISGSLQRVPLPSSHYETARYHDVVEFAFRRSESRSVALVAIVEEFPFAERIALKGKW